VIPAIKLAARNGTRDDVKELQVPPLSGFVPVPAPTPAPLPTPAPTPPGSGLSGDVSKSKGNRKTLVGEQMELERKDKVQGTLQCTCTSKKCNVDLHLMIYRSKQQRWRTIAVSRSRTPNEKLRAKLRKPKAASLRFVAWPKRGSASCQLISEKL
jgi:hypothetical protein